MNIDSITQVDENITKREDMPMKKASTLDYNIINEYKDFKPKSGTCVIDILISMYGEALGFTENTFNAWLKYITNYIILDC